MATPTSMDNGAVMLRDLEILQEVLERADPTLKATWVDIIKEKLVTFSASTGMTIEQLVENMGDQMQAIAASIIITVIV